MGGRRVATNQRRRITPERVAPIVLVLAGHGFEAFPDRREEDARFLENVGQLVETGRGEVLKGFVIFGNQPLIGFNVAILPLEQNRPAAEIRDEGALVVIRAIRGFRRRLL